MDEEAVQKATPTVGDQLRAARKRKKLSLEDIAAQTRIPQRHLQSLEDSDWVNLPAPTYTVGFAKSFAAAVDLDRTEIGEQLRAEMGDVRMVPMAPAEVFEPADPARTMPKWLVLGGIAAVILLILLMRWLNNRELYGTDDAPAANAVAASPAPVAPPPAPVVQGPVVLSASEPLWMAVKERGGETYFAGILKPGTDFTVPPNASAPLLSTAKPEALTIRVGTTTAPAVGAPGSSVTDVSLLPADLLKAGDAASAPSRANQLTTMAPAPTPSPRVGASAPRRRQSPPPVAPPPAPAPQPLEPQPANTAG